VFFEQPSVPPSRPERAYLADQLVRLARRVPDRRVLLKPRNRPGELTLHRCGHPLEALVDQRLRSGTAPPNLLVTHRSVETLLADAGHALSVSSTALVEAMAAGVPSTAIADFGVDEDNGVTFFLGSGCVGTLADFDGRSARPPDPAWLARNILAPGASGEALLDAILDKVRAHRNGTSPVPPRPVFPHYGARAFHEALAGTMPGDRIARRSFRRAHPLTRVLRVFGR
jgi:hypothetical protein